MTTIEIITKKPAEVAGFVGVNGLVTSISIFATLEPPAAP
jgi:hypothetical protein